MRKVYINQNESGQRLDKFLLKYMNLAGKSFIYKMLRKKNIVLNNKKCDGSERLCMGDEVKLYLSEETIEKFTEVRQQRTDIDTSQLDIVYEDENIAVLNKPVGLLSQKAEGNDISLVELFNAYLINENKLSPEDLKTFRPSVCNRLDRNTSGLVVAGKSLIGLQTISEAFRKRTIKKYYMAIVDGIITSSRRVNAYIYKDESANTVSICDAEHVDAQHIITEYEPVSNNGRITLLKVHLITGRSHQIRAHLAALNHPVIGDNKYGNAAVNRRFRSDYGIRNQLLHAYQLIMPEFEGGLHSLSGKIITAELPENFKAVISGEGISI